MTCANLTDSVFIAEYPEFENEPNIDLFLNRAILYFDKCTCFCDREKQYIVFLLTAHLLTQNNEIQEGDISGGIQTSASIDKISVSVAPAPYEDGFEYWLSQTKYGQQLLAFINIKTITPTYIGGSFNRVL